MIQSMVRGLREIRRRPFTWALAVLSIGLAVGSSALVFSWLESTVLDPYPAVAEPARLVALNERAPDGGEWTVSWPVYQDWTRNRTFDGVAAWTGVRLLRRSTGGPPRDVWTLLVSANYFDVLGVRLGAGRSFTAEDQVAALPVTVISWSYWQREYGGEPGVLGSSIDVNGIELTIVGIGPPGFVGTYVGAGFDIWVPATLQQSLLGQNELEDRQARWLQAFARLRPGGSIEAARTEFDAYALAASRAAGDVPVTGALAQPLRMQFLGSLVFPLFMAMLAITSLIVLIACANIAGIQLERSLAKQVETTVRAALGAGRLRLLGAALVDSMLIGVPGFVVAIALVVALRSSLVSLVPPVPLRVELPVAVDPRVLLVTAAATLGATLLFSVAPVVRSWKTDPAGVLREARGGPRTQRYRSASAVVQLAFTMLAVTCAILFVLSIRRSRRLDLGFTAPATLYLAGTEIPGTDGPVRLRTLLETVRAAPGVTAATVSTMVPLGFGGHRYSDVAPEGYTASPDDNVSAERVAVGASYFSTMGTRLVGGREFSEADRSGSQPVVIVNEAFARRFWPGVDALGRKVTQSGRTGTVVGIAADGRYRNLDDADYPVVYWPIEQAWEPRFTVILRSAAPPWDGLRTAFARTGPDLPLLAPRALAEHIRAATFVQEAGAVFLGGFGTLALIMAMIGLYATLAHGVSTRVREIGVRLALGAGPGDVVRLVLGRVFRLWSLGLLAGVPVTAGSAFLLRGQLAGTAPLEPLAFVAGIGVLAIASLTAAVVPALRAAGLQPVTALSH